MCNFLSHTRILNGFLPNKYVGNGYPLPSLALGRRCFPLPVPGGPKASFVYPHLGDRPGFGGVNPTGAESYPSINFVFGYAQTPPNPFIPQEK
jgi:hypothetical protein